MRKDKQKELISALTLSDKETVLTKYNNQIKYYDHLLYSIKFEYYDIVGKLNEYR